MKVSSTIGKFVLILNLYNMIRYEIISWEETNQSFTNGFR
jgi:hypothetical protein